MRAAWCSAPLPPVGGATELLQKLRAGETEPRFVAAGLTRDSQKCVIVMIVYGTVYIYFLG